MTELIQLLSSVDVTAVKLGFVLAKDNFEQAYRAFLNLYYPRNKKWMEGHWDNYELHGYHLWNVINEDVDKDILSISIDIDYGHIKVIICGFVHEYDIEDEEWQYDELDSIIKLLLIEDVMPLFYIYIHGQAPTDPNQLTLFDD